MEARKLGKPSVDMIRVLNDIHEGSGTHYNCQGMSEHGGRCAILQALMRRGWIDRDYKITKAGLLELSHLNN